MSRGIARSSGGAMARVRLLLTIAALLAFPLACHVIGASADPRAVALAVGAPVLLNLILCVLFARTLRGGGEPLITRFARVARGGSLPAELARYTRRLTAAWAAFFALMAMTSAALALWGSFAAWSLFTNVLNYVLVAVFFVAEYAYRRVRYRQFPHASPADMVRRLQAYRPW
jgi:uncharacterized membrane protein